MPLHIQTVDASKNDHHCQLIRARHNHPNAIPTKCVLDLVIGVTQRAGQTLIDQLDIIGHGCPGQLNVGGGISPRRDQVIAVDDSFRLYNREILALLRGRFASGAVVRLHACRVAEGVSGECLLYQLSQLWQVRVQGGLIRQMPDAADRFEGNLYRQADGSPNSLEPLYQGPIAR